MMLLSSHARIWPASGGTVKFAESKSETIRWPPVPELSKVTLRYEKIIIFASPACKTSKAPSAPQNIDLQQVVALKTLSVSPSHIVAVTTSRRC